MHSSRNQSDNHRIFTYKHVPSAAVFFRLAAFFHAFVLFSCYKLFVVLKKDGRLVVLIHQLNHKLIEFLHPSKRFLFSLYSSYIMYAVL